MTLLEEFYATYSKPKTKMPPQKRILFELLADFTDRRGLRQEWDQIGDDVQEEILTEWLHIITRAM